MIALVAKTRPVVDESRGPVLTRCILLPCGWGESEVAIEWTDSLRSISCRVGGAAGWGGDPGAEEGASENGIVDGGEPYKGSEVVGRSMEQGREGGGWSSLAGTAERGSSAQHTTPRSDDTDIFGESFHSAHPVETCFS